MDAMDPFERRIKDSLEEFEVPYNSADWGQLEQRMAGGSGHRRLGKSGLLALLLAGGMAAVGGAYWWASTDEPGTSGTTGAGQATPGVVAQAPARAEAAVPEEHPAAAAPETRTMTGTAPAAATGTATTPTRPVQPRSHTPSPDAASATGASSSYPTKDDGTMAFRASAAEGCPGTAIQFAAPNMPQDAIYLWNFGDGSFSNQPRPDHTFAKAGKFEVMLSVSNPAGGAIQSKPSSDLIVIHEAPEAAFSTQKMDYEGHIPSVHFENRSIGGKSFTWDFGDGSTSTLAHPDHIYLKKGSYTVRLKASNEVGCTDTRELEVKIDRDYNLDAPLSFSPNGDGTDDLFMPEALRTLGVRFNLVVQDAITGRKVYETSDATRPWTGHVDNRSEVCPAGDYVWMATIREGAHLGDVVFNGKVSLVR